MQELITNLTVTISSVELVKYINEQRDKGSAELQHKNFTAKVLKVLGEEDSLKFSGEYLAGNGKMEPCYNLPKREACLMVMSESYKVQAAVYDRLSELEATQNKPSMPVINDPQIAALIMALQGIDQVKQEQSKQGQLLIKQQSQIEEIKAKAISSPQDYFTVAGYASVRGINIDVKQAATLGRKAVKISKEMDLQVNKVHSEVFGNVNTYHVDVLCVVFNK